MRMEKNEICAIASLHGLRMVKRSNKEEMRLLKANMENGVADIISLERLVAGVWDDIVPSGIKKYVKLFLRMFR